MPFRRPHSLLALIIALGLPLMTACSGTSSVAQPTSSPTMARVTPKLGAPTALPTVTPEDRSCAEYANGWPGVVRVGDLLIQQPFTVVDAIEYQLPDGIAQKPLAVPARSSTGQFAGWPDSTLGATSITTAVCNACAATSYTIQGARVKLTAFTAYNGQLNAWDYCAGAYVQPTGVSPNNCDRRSAPIDEQLQAAIGPTAQVGDAIAATQPDAPSGGFGPLPATLPPGVVMYLNVSLSVGTPGTSRFAVSVSADGAALPYTGEASLLLAPIGHLWNGQACTAPGMLAQLPPSSNPPTAHICPAS